MAIKINHGLRETICELHSPDKVFEGYVTNSVQLVDLRLQIATHKVKGYYLIIPNAQRTRVDILENGDLSCWPKDFYTERLNITLKIVKLNKLNENKIKP